MNISYNWLKSYLSITASPQEIAERLTQVGLEVSKITPFVPMSGDLVIGETLDCIKHPNADKLKVLKVDIGNSEIVSIVCGAPNVEAGQKVVVAPVGSKITTLDGQVHKIKRAKIRGQVSEGMICSAYELGISDEHDGILVIDTPRPVGTAATLHFGMLPDTIFEIEITPNMGNACSHLGVARELAALSGKRLEQPMAEPLITSGDLSVKVEVLDASLSPRYTGVVIKDITVGPSPAWLRNKLSSIGIKSINNVVDVTNFVMHGMGQPLHAFDYDKVEGKKIYVGRMKKGIKMETLAGDSVTLGGKELMIYDEKGPLCLAGIIGGSRAEVSQSTRTIFLESACFAPSVIAHSVRRHNIHSDAGFRFERGVDIELAYVALQKGATLIKKLGGGVVASTPIDDYRCPVRASSIAMRYDYIDRLLGKPLRPSAVHNVLNRLDIRIKDSTEEGFTALVPPYRMDVLRPADVVEEIIRIHGYREIKPRGLYQGVPYDEVGAERSNFKAKEAMADRLAAQGYQEIVTNSLLSEALLCKGERPCVKVINSWSQSLDTLRPSMLYTGLEAIAYNLKRGNGVLKCFEMGRVFGKKKQGYDESEVVAMFLAGDVHAPHWYERPRAVALHDLYTTVTDLLSYYGAPSLEARQDKHPYYDSCMTLIKDGERYATLGMVRRDLCEKMGIKVAVCFTELSIDSLQALQHRREDLRYRPYPQTPAVTRDISLALPIKVSYTEIVAVIKGMRMPYHVEVTLKDLYQGKGVAKGEKSYTIGLTLQGEKTFREAEITHVITKIEEALKAKLKATVRA